MRLWKKSEIQAQLRILVNFGEERVGMYGREMRCDGMFWVCIGSAFGCLMNALWANMRYVLSMGVHHLSFYHPPKLGTVNLASEYDAVPLQLTVYC